MKNLLLLFTALSIVCSLQAQKATSVVLNLSSGVAGFGFQEEDSRISTATERKLLRASAANLYFFNPSIRTFDSSGFREIGVKGVYFNRTSAEAANYHSQQLDGPWTFDSLSKLNITSFGAGLYYGRSTFLRKLSKNSSLFLGYNVVLKHQHLRLMELKDAPTSNWEYISRINKWSLLTTIIPRYTYQLNSSLIFDISLPLQTLSVGYIMNKEVEESRNLDLRKGWFDMAGHWDFGFQVSLGVIL